jgi:hypothetical protein
VSEPWTCRRRADGKVELAVPTWDAWTGDRTVTLYVISQGKANEIALGLFEATNEDTPVDHVCGLYSDAATQAGEERGDGR